eukprot:5807013-Amphidinium_carterae.2
MPYLKVFGGLQSKGYSCIIIKVARLQKYSVDGYMGLRTRWGRSIVADLIQHLGYVEGIAIHFHGIQGSRT